MSEPTPIHLVLGDEPLLMDETVDSIVSAAFEGGSPGFNLATYAAGEGAGSAVSTARTMPMMARRRVVVIRELEKANAALLDELIAYAANPNPSSVLVLVGTKLPLKADAGDRGAALRKAVQSVGAVRSFRAGERKPTAFAQEHAASLGCSLRSHAASLLVELTGSDLGRVRSEVEKAAAFVGGKGEIGTDAVEAVCSLVAEAEVWDLTDAVLRRDVDKGMAAAHRMLEQAAPGENASHRLLAMITWQVRQLLELQYATRTGSALPPSWQRTPSFKLRAARETLERHPLQAHRILDALARANRSFNRSRAGDRRVFEALVLKLTSA